LHEIGLVFYLILQTNNINYHFIEEIPSDACSQPIVFLYTALSSDLSPTNFQLIGSSIADVTEIV